MPSFHTDCNDFDAESVFTKWLYSNFIKRCHPGIIFLHSLDCDPTHDTMLMLRHLETFAKAFLNTFAVPSRVYVVPTSKPDSAIPNESLSPRLSQLETIMGALNGNGKHKWRASMFPGVFKGQPETAWSAVLLLLKGIAETETNFSHGYTALEDLVYFFFEEVWGGASNGNLDLIVMLGRIVLELTPPEHPQHCSILINLSQEVGGKVFSYVFETLAKIPTRLLHTQTGVLCNRDAQLSKFMGSPRCKQLLSSLFSFNSQQITKEITDAVSEFFEFAMLSHRWGGGEPLLRDVEGKTIYDVDATDGLEKLQTFCALALRHNFQWAWSDTCCIDKESSIELQMAIGSMFSWYRRSSLTIVYLSDVSHTGSLAKSVWFGRGWTLQELLASRTVLFYTHDWSLYMNREATNHKTDPALLEELQQATGIAKRHLTNFYPGLDDARSRLHWASRRRTTWPEDIVYSLFGIFKLNLPVLYGESVENALGRLLAEIISHSGDVSVLDWVGEPSPFHSCFPASLTPYRTVPHIQLIPSDPAQRHGLDLAKARELYNALARLPLARCVNRRLMLPSTIHPVTAVKLQGSSINPSRYTYEIHARRLRPFVVTISVDLDHNSGRYILVRPWLRKSLETRTDSDDEAVWNLLEQLEQPFNALLLEALPHNEYRRIVSDCVITARVQDLASILDSETRILGIV
ncbi:hypothetical protein EDC04DRAFT_346077 [Pisolithus marmoratus]|nr:hypothetical protein EDC04DRAFT_346077 [Pisolithus marmoratus]